MLSFPSGNLPSTLKSGHQFSQVPQADIQRSSFDRSHGCKTAFNSGYLIPIYVDEALPGDSFNLKLSSFARLSTPIVPFMDNLYLSTFFFAVPYRLVWANFKKFCGEQATTSASTAFTMPVFTAYTPAAESLSDYMGIPTAGSTTPIGASGTLSHVSLWHRAYNLIWNEWFRDQNLQDSVVVDIDDGPDAIADYVLLKRGKRHDYFTSCLPSTQKNNTGSPVTIGLAGTAPVIGNGKVIKFYDGSGHYGAVLSGGGYMEPRSGIDGQDVGSWGGTGTSGINKKVGLTLLNDGTSGIIADLAASSGITINALRLAMQTQKMYERDARGGTRYREIVQSHFGVLDPNDSRLQRPEYLGGGTAPIMLTPIPQTSATSGALATGRLSAAGIVTVHGHGFTKSFSEHCLLIGLACVFADLNYQTGLNRMFSRSTRLDMYWPALANIGEQAVLNKEIYCQGSANAAQDAATFGYQERFAEYRYKPSTITGKMRSQYATPLDYWHLAQKFTGLPTLGATFIAEAPPIDRVVAVSTEPQLFGDFFFDLKCARPMPTYSVPGLIDHF